MNLFRKALVTFNNIHFQSLLGNGVMAVFGVVILGLLYRALSIVDIGIYVFFMTILGLIDTVKSGLLTNSFLKFYSGTSPQRGKEVVGSAWTLALVISSLFLLINVITLLLSQHFPNLNVGIVLLLKYFSLITFATLPSFMANLVVQGDKRFDRLLWMRLINQILFAGGIVTLILLNKSTLVLIIYVYIGSNLISSIATLLLGWTKIYAIKYNTKATFLELFHFGKFSMGTSLSANLFKVTDIFFINFFLGPAALAMYNLSGRLIQFVEIPLLSFAASGMPSLASHYNHGEKDKMMYLMKKIVGMLTIGICFITIISLVFAQPIIGLIGGAKYYHSDAINLFRIFMSIAILFPADRFFALTLDVTNQPQVNFYKILMMLAVNLLADYFGILIFNSVFAIVIANIFPVVTAIIISYSYLNRYYKFNFWSMYKIGFNETLIFIKQLNFRFFVSGK